MARGIPPVVIQDGSIVGIIALPLLLFIFLANLFVKGPTGILFKLITVFNLKLHIHLKKKTDDSFKTLLTRLLNVENGSNGAQ